MTFRYWYEVEKVLAGVTTCVTKEPQELAKRAGIDLPSNTPKVVAAALLRVALAEQLGLSLQTLSLIAMRLAWKRFDEFLIPQSLRRLMKKQKHGCCTYESNF
jgi:hypothetical protein